MRLGQPDMLSAARTVIEHTGRSGRVLNCGDLMYRLMGCDAAVYWQGLRLQPDNGEVWPDGHCIPRRVAVKASTKA